MVYNRPTCIGAASDELRKAVCSQRMASCKKVGQPHPEWTPGTKQPHPFPDNEMIELDPVNYPGSAMYPFIISSVVPRPIGFICSLSKQVLVSELQIEHDNGLREKCHLLGLMASDDGCLKQNANSLEGFTRNYKYSIKFVRLNSTPAFKELFYTFLNLVKISN